MTIFWTGPAINDLHTQWTVVCGQETPFPLITVHCSLDTIYP